VTVVARECRPRPRIRPHSARTLAFADRAAHRGIPVTSPGRTLLDFAGEATRRELERAVEEAQVQRLASPAALRGLLERNRGHRGAGALAAAIRAEPALTRSEAERLMLDLVRDAGLPRPASNARVGRYEVDLLWRKQRLAVEVDGFAFHGTREAFERDRRRDAELQTRGYRVLRVTYRQLTAEREALVARLAVALEA